MLNLLELDDKVNFGLANRAERRRYAKLLRRAIVISHRRKFEKRWIK